MAQLSRRNLVRAAAGSAVVAATSSQWVSPAYAAGRRIAIIGSGYGGAVAARALGTAGYSADLIEMGMDWSKASKYADGTTFNKISSPTDRATWFQDKTEPPVSSVMGIPTAMTTGKAAGILGIEHFANMKVYVGKGLGGGSLVNGAMAVTPRQSFFSKVLPQVDAAEMYATYFPRVNSRLGTATIPSDVEATSAYQFARVGVAQAAKAGYSKTYVPNVYDWDYMRKEIAGSVPKSALNQEVIYGNNYGKKDLTKTYLKEALATGRITVKTMTEVTQIRRLPDGTYGLTLKTINYWGEVLSVAEVIYDRVILAAGSVASSRLLVQAKAKGLITGLNDAIGKKWGPNGNTMAARYLWTTATGATQSTIPGLAINAWNDGPGSAFLEVAPFPAGMEMYTSLYLAVTYNPNLANFTYNSSTGGVDLGWNSTMHAPSVAAAKAVLDKINAANPTTIYRTDLFEDGKKFTDYFAYHPLGGLILGEATDLNGEVKGANGVFVMDGSQIPGMMGVNPFLTITALAERNMDRLIAAGRFA